MILIVKGKRYQTTDLGKVKIGVHRQVQAEFGIGWADINAYMNTIEGAQIGNLIGVPEFEAWMLFWILAGGTPMTRSDIDELTLDDIDFEEPAAAQAKDVVEELPTSARTGSAPGARKRTTGQPRQRQRSTTSKPRSQSA